MNNEPLKLSDVPIESVPLATPSLDDIVKAFKKQLSSNFEIVSSEVVECPDLTQEPFNLADKGISGNTSILDVGGSLLLLPAPRSKIYDLKSIPALLGEEKSFVLGAGAGPWPYFGVNCELFCNCTVTKKRVAISKSKVFIIDNGEPKLLTVPNTESRYCLSANLFCSKGETGNVIKVHCKKRIDSLDFITALRLALAVEFPGLTIGMGGVFVMLSGTARQHLLPDFSSPPIRTKEELNVWLQFYEMSAPLTALGTFVSKDPGLDLKIQHFHSVGNLEGGHYYNDITPDVEYLAYFSLANKLYRIDRPVSGKIEDD